MGAKTGIEWTDATWNPILGCSRVSEGCRNCYAEGIAGRFGQGKQTVYSGLTQIVNGRPVWTGQIKETRQLLEPLSWKQPKRVFVNSMSDLFHENVTDEMRDRIFAVMALCPQHTFQVLTKRPVALWDYLFLINSSFREAMIGKEALKIHHARTGEPVLEWSGLPMPNVLLGFSAENQETFDARWKVMGRLATGRPEAQFSTFASLEPLLGPIDMGRGRLPGWVIVGGESGPHARPMHPDWARSLRDQCQAASVPFFFKQWGEWAEVDGGAPNHIFDVDKQHASIDATNCVIALDGHVPRTEHEMFEDVRYRWMSRVGKKAAGALLDGCEWNEFPAVPRAVSR